jgi:hypothetical protein
MKISCPHCGRSLALRGKILGQVIACPVCGKKCRLAGSADGPTSVGDSPVGRPLTGDSQGQAAHVPAENHQPDLNGPGKTTPASELANIDNLPSGDMGRLKALYVPLFIVVLAILSCLNFAGPGLLLSAIRCFMAGCIAITGIGCLYCCVCMILQASAPPSKTAVVSFKPVIVSGVTSAFAAVLGSAVLLVIPPAAAGVGTGRLSNESTGSRKPHSVPRSDSEVETPAQPGLLGQAITHALKANPSKRASTSQRRLARDFKGTITGTFATQSSADRPISMAFLYPYYVLNPSKDYTWASGNTGQWDLLDDGESLTAADRAAGHYLMILKPPDAPHLSVPCKVKLDFDEHGNVAAISFSSLLGIQFGEGKRCVLHRSAGH